MRLIALDVTAIIDGYHLIRIGEGTDDSRLRPVRDDAKSQSMAQHHWGALTINGVVDPRSRRS